jgi:hypothetical protein
MHQSGFKKEKIHPQDKNKEWTRFCQNQHRG